MKLPVIQTSQTGDEVYSDTSPYSGCCSLHRPVKIYCQCSLKYDDQDLQADDRDVRQRPILRSDAVISRALVVVVVPSLLPAVVVLIVERRQQQVGHRQQAP